jgi:hypothetical protein
MQSSELIETNLLPTEHALMSRNDAYRRVDVPLTNYAPAAKTIKENAWTIKENAVSVSHSLLSTRLI